MTNNKRKQNDIEQDLDISVDDDNTNDLNGLLDKKISSKVASTTYVEQWVNRRKMAWVTLLSMIIFVFLVVFMLSEPRLKIVEGISGYFMMAMASVVMAYMGFSTWASIYKK